MMVISKVGVKNVYQRYANSYDTAVNLYRLIGLHIEHYRTRAVDLLHLARGDHVLELGCGTGLNFSRIQQQIKSDGQLIGIDTSDRMLAVARDRVESAGWKNVQLINTDLLEYEINAGINAVLATGVLGYVNERAQVIENISQKLKPGGRIAVFDLKRPTQWPSWMFKTAIWLASPFGVTEEYFDNDTWEVIDAHFSDTVFEEYYGGLVYISSGATPA
jgi:demethylmenaquinone methyltransferase/2-methoxy-6-polyprenyl-1,4-benzoquinol methylase